ncbi:nucleophile aminohydrolase [Jimgerdemannia flammicorona]|uniref:Proteasome subunit beta n=1 Tax=Jimgerdemannia flammicorona TaxID=994334 RepID=A0A433QVY7_9FUNG|nr:nucleophile aminohydrolase [Jimgerdemannia flammicorona]
MSHNHRFNPYENNGGSALAIAGEDFCVIASDTRQSIDYHVNSRYAPKAYKVSNTAVLATSGFHADGQTLVKRIGQRLEWYKHAHDKEMTCPALAQMLSITLYLKRFFPYYAFCVLGGLDAHGKGAVYSYDSVGSHERHAYRASGSAAELIQPFLDNQVGFKNQANVTRRLLPLDTVLRIAKDAFTSATERNITTGDCLEIFIVTKAGVEVQQYPLKRD